MSTKELLNKKAEIGDIIISYDFNDEHGCRSNYATGVVTGLKVENGVEYVEFTAVSHTLVDRLSGSEIGKTYTNKKMRTPQNGTVTQFGNVLNTISVIKGE